MARYDILVYGKVIFHNVSESEADELCDMMDDKHWLYGDYEVVSINE